MTSPTVMSATQSPTAPSDCHTSSGRGARAMIQIPGSITSMSSRPLVKLLTSGGKNTHPQKLMDLREVSRVREVASS